MQKEKKNDFTVNLYFDTRRQREDGTYPLKIVVYCKHTKKRRYYQTKFNLTSEDYDRANNSIKPRGEVKRLKRNLEAAVTHVTDIAETLKPFSLQGLDFRIKGKSKNPKKVSFHYTEKIDRFKNAGRISTSETYFHSFKSITDYCSNKMDYSSEDLIFEQITPGWLQGYEDYMKLKGRTSNTIGIYLRCLKAIFNKAIEEKEVSSEVYPFGKKKFRIPATVNNKRALTSEQVTELFKAEPQNPEQQKAKDFWFLSLYCSGANITDIVHWQWKNKIGKKIEYYRAKTKNTTKDNQKPINFFLNDFCLEVIEKYGTPRAPENYIFDIIDHSMTPEIERSNIKAFTRYINQHLKILAKENGLPEGISTYYARHSFATIGVQRGLSLEFMKEALGHKSIATTENYFSGFDNETKKEFPNQLQNLIEGK